VGTAPTQIRTVSRICANLDCVQQASVVTCFEHALNPENWIVRSWSFRGTIPWLRGAENEKALKFSDAQTAFIFEARGGRVSRLGDLSQGRDQPGDLLQLEEEI
jgi:hypothetical protein